MACDLSAYVIAPEIQGQLTDLWKVDPYAVTEFPLVSFFYGTLNNRGVMKELVSPGLSETRTVTVVYPQQHLLSEVSTSIDPCATGAARGMKSTDYTIDPDTGFQLNELFKPAQLRTIGQDNKSFMATRMASLMTGVLKKMERTFATQLAALNGAFSANDRDFDNGAIGSNIKKVRTRISAGQLDPLTKKYVTKSARLARYGAAPIVIGDGIYTEDVMLSGYGVPYDFGVNLGAVASREPMQVIESEDMWAALESAVGAGAGRTHFMSIAPGAIIPIDYNRYTADQGEATMLNNWTDTSRLKTTIAHPTGVIFDLRMEEGTGEGNCDSVNMKIWTSSVLKGLPSDLYCDGDDLDGNKLAQMFYVQNP